MSMDRNHRADKCAPGVCEQQLRSVRHEPGADDLAEDLHEPLDVTLRRGLRGWPLDCGSCCVAYLWYVQSTYLTYDTATGRACKS